VYLLYCCFSHFFNGWSNDSHPPGGAKLFPVFLILAPSGASSHEIRALLVHIRQVSGVALVQPRAELVVLFVHLDQRRLNLAGVIPSFVEGLGQQ